MFNIYLIRIIRNPISNQKMNFLNTLMTQKMKNQKLLLGNFVTEIVVPYHIVYYSLLINYDSRAK